MSFQHRFPILFLILLTAFIALTPSLAASAPRPAFAPVSAPQQDEGDIEAVGHIGGMAFAINLTDDARHAFMGVGSGLHVFDISDPAHPRQVTVLPLRAGGLLGLVRSGSTLYAASFHGLRIFDVSQPTQPTQLGQWDGDELRDVDVAGTTLYLAGGEHGLRILDVSNPASPQLLGTFATPGHADQVAIAGATAYVTCRIDRDPCPNAGLLIVDVSDPAHPEQLAAFAAPDMIHGLAVADQRAYLAVEEAGLLILDVSDPAHPAQLGAYDSPGWAVDVAVDGTTAYLADGFRGLHSLNVSDPAHPARQGGYDALAAYALALGGTRLFVGGMADLYGLDVSQPTTPALLGETAWPMSIEDAFIPQAAAATRGGGGAAYGYFAGMEKLWVMDLTDPAMPATAAAIPFTAGFPKRVFVADDLAYVMQSSFGLEIFDVSDPLHPAAAGKFQVNAERRNDVFAQAGYAYLTTYASGGKLMVLDMHDPAHPQKVGEWATPGSAERVFVNDNMAYVADGDAGLRIIDVSDPAHPAELGHLAPPEGTSSTAIFVDGTTVYLGSNGESGARMQKIDVSDPAHPQVAATFQLPSPKRVQDFDMASGELYAAVDGGSLYVLNKALTPSAIYHGDHTLGVAASATITDVFGYLSGSSAYGEEIIRRPPPAQPGQCSLVGVVKPDKAKGDGCSVEPERVTCTCGEEEVTFKAKAANGWALDGWNPGPKVKCPTSGEGQAVANFTPTLTTAGQGDGFMCSKDKQTTQNALGFGLSASEADSWAVSEMTFQADGNGDDKKAIKKVRLYQGGNKLGETTYSGDDAAVQFTFTEIVIPAGQTVTFRLEYEFDPEAMEECSTETQEFGVTLASHNALPEHYPPGQRLGTAPHGNIQVGCVQLKSASGQFINAFDTIQDAVDAAGAQQIVEVCPGTYEENVDVPKSLTIRSRDGRDVTTVHAKKTDDHVFDVKANEVTIQGFRIEWAIGQGKAGIHLGGVKKCEVFENMVNNNQAGILIDEGASQNRIYDNWIINNSGTGIVIEDASENVIGGTSSSQRNLISYNLGYGVEILGGQSQGNQVLGNDIGADGSNEGSGNDKGGVRIADFAAGNRIGDAEEGAGNVIAHNGGPGVIIEDDPNNVVLHNAIFANKGPGIDHGNDGITENDPDDGIQDFLIFEDVQVDGNKIEASGVISGAPGSTVLLEFFDSDAYDDDGNIQGWHYLGSKRVSIGSEGRGSFESLVFNWDWKYPHLTATATRVDNTMTPVTTSEFTPVDLSILGVEVTQAIQDMSNSVSLVAGKDTYVFVHVRSLGAIEMPDIRVRLTGWRNNHKLGTLLPRPERITVKQVPKRKLQKHSFRFVLPFDWIRSGSLKLKAEIDYAPHHYHDASHGNNEKTVTVEFSSEPWLRLRIYRVSFPSILSLGWKTAKLATAERVASSLRTMYPVPAVYAEHWLFTYYLPVSYFDKMALSQLNLEMSKARRYARLWGEVDSDVIFYAIVPGVAEGLAAPLLYVASGGDGNSIRWDANTGPHELGHIFGRSHVCTPEGDESYCDGNYPYPKGFLSWEIKGANLEEYGPTVHFGYDPLDDEEPIHQYNSVADIMSYNPGGRWISDYTWNGIREWRSSMSAQAQQAMLPAGEYVMISGLINLDKDTAEFSPFQRLSQLPEQPAPTPGPYTLRLLNANGQELAAYAFTPAPFTCVHSDEDAAAIFVEMIPWAEGTARIELVHGGEVLATQTVSPHSPTVNITQPQAGDTLNEKTDVMWTAEDADGDELTYTVFYSADDGQTWDVIASDWPTPTLPLDVTTLRGSNQARLRVIASDGVNTGQADSDTFTIPPNAPTPIIFTPVDGRDYDLDEVVDLYGGAWDTEDGELADASLAWTDSVSGPLGTGKILYAVELSPGYHTITLTATDSDGMSATDSVTIYIGHRVWLPTMYRR